MAALYPLRFEPLFRRYLWGGRRLGDVLGKPIGVGTDYAESWELVDHGQDQSVVANGPLQGLTLADLAARHPRELYGRHCDQCVGKRFSLLFKFLDANQKLSVQVHPDDAAAARLTPPDLGKTEAWVILHADPGSCVYAGLKRGFDRAALAREVNRGTTELCLNRLEPRAGDCIFIPAGIVHALGQGLLVAEIQQASDTTFRLFDWNRVGPDGKPRALHVEAGLDAIRYDAELVAPQVPASTDHGHVSRLVRCDKFVLDRWRFDAPQTMLSDDRFQIVTVTKGDVTLRHNDQQYPLTLGSTSLLPACVREVQLQAHTDSELLVAYLP